MATPILFVHKLRFWEIHRLQREIRSARDPQYRDRLDAVLLSAERWSVDRISRVLGKSYCAVRLWILDFERFGVDGLKLGKSPGRPRKIGPDEEACLKSTLDRNPRDLGYRFTRWTLPTLREHLYRELHVQISSPALGRTLKRLGFRYKRPKHSLKHKQDRRKVRKIRRERDGFLKKWLATRTASCFSTKTSANFTCIPG